MTDRWFAKRGDERFWLETTDRDDIGVNLKAPQRGESGQQHPAYVLMLDVEHGDVVYHYSTPLRAIVAWSRAVGSPYSDTIVWGTHAGTTAERVPPHPRPGWYVGLEGPFPIHPPVSLADLRARQTAIAAIRGGLARKYPRASLYYPFEVSSRRDLRPTQFYLTKLPAALVDMFPSLKSAAGSALSSAVGLTVASPPVTSSARSGNIGTAYRRPSPSTGTARMEPFSIDPDVVDRGREGHRLTQDELESRIRSIGSTPVSAKPDEPQFDVGWESNGVFFTAEVKSLTRRNEERQLRLGLGQVLRYQHLLATKTGRRVKAVLAVERKPEGEGWLDLCSMLGVLLVWRGDMSAVK